ncbi:MAG: ABC transporter ATP-binding protein, partial [Actinobacteria bacterium]|nr:ABC transporter ATP-binding protein [Actinomycetota bacterium]
VGTTVVIGMLSQVIEETPGEASVLGYIESLRPTIEIEGVEVSARSLLERFGFRGNRLTTFVRDLSGGERRRLALLTVLLGSPNVLLLDEPTNDLDTDTAAEFESLLDTWPGTVVSVSHDRYFLERTCDQMYALLPTPSGAAALRHLPGGIEQYLALRAPVQAPPPAKAAAAAPTAGLQGSALHTARKNIQRIERRLEKIEQLQEDVAAQLTQNATDYEHLQAVAQQAQELADEREQLEAEWLEISADIEG